MSKPPGYVVLGILTQLEEQGPMTRAQLCTGLGQERMKVGAVVSRMNRPCKTVPKRIYIDHYVHDEEGGRNYPRAVYAIGNKPDAPRPVRNKAAVTKRARAAKTARVSSVWEFAMPRRARKARERSIRAAAVA